ncbi:unnamed protein product [Rangifer tarandus platyrhynchus]|uniref:Uncharacterized protein n=1 Tax=Rangifer tarandus platyrhynchus TaxID=3082113 RepID=A0AC59YFA7_RANTA
MATGWQVRAARWRGPFCPVTLGLPPAPGSAVTPVTGPNEGWEDGRQGPLRGAVAEGEPPCRQLLGAEHCPGKAISVSFFY